MVKGPARTRSTVLFKSIDSGCAKYALFQTNAKKGNRRSGNFLKLFKKYRDSGNRILLNFKPVCGNI